MKKEIGKKILRDYREASNNVLRILSSKSNFVVKSQDYLGPIISFTQVSMDDSRGELRYFKKIRDCLEDILIHEKTQFKLPNAPDYIKEFE